MVSTPSGGIGGDAAREKQNVAREKPRRLLLASSTRIYSGGTVYLSIVPPRRCDDNTKQKKSANHSGATRNWYGSAYL